MSAMKELVCNYALIRFLPYRETGEFVNVGVVLYAPETNYFGFKLTERRNSRVRKFFPELDPSIYRAAIGSLRRELERNQDQFHGLFGAVSEGLTAFRAMLRLRESLLHFAEPGMKLGMPSDVLDKLFCEYVQRSFAHSAAYQETEMRHRLAGWLKDWGLRPLYKTDRLVGDEMFRLTLPFVHFDKEKITAAIKPLDLNRTEPTEVYNHGGDWVQRFRRLQRRGTMPAKMVVPVQFPIGKARQAADEVIVELGAEGVQVADFNDAVKLRDLANV